MITEPITFKTRIEYANCINTLVEVTGSRDEGIIAVYAIGYGHVGEDITDSLRETQKDQIYDELQQELVDGYAAQIDRTYDDLRDQQAVLLYERD